jgi:hypothetical protein
VTLSNFSKYGILRRPAARKATIDQACVDSVSPRAFADADAFAVDRYQPTSRSVRLLLNWRSPNTIIRRVWTIIVAAVDAMTCGRTPSHISKEVFKFIPAFADRDSSSAVAIPSLVFRTGAAPFHRLPYPIFGGVGAAVCNKLSLGFLFHETSAANDSASAQIVHSLNTFIAAIANEIPPTMFFGAMMHGQHKQATKSFICEVDSVRHERIIAS